MNKLYCLLLALFIFQDASSQCKPVFIPLSPKLPSGNSGFNSSGSPYRVHFELMNHIYSRSVSGKMEAYYNVFNGTQWNATPVLSFTFIDKYNSIPNIRKYKGDIIASGRFKQIGTKTAAPGKYFAVAILKNNTWDTFPGSQIDSSLYFYTFANTENDLYFDVQDTGKNVRTGTIYKYDTSAMRFVKLADYLRNVYAVSLKGGKNRLLIGNILKLNNVAVKGFSYEENDSIKNNYDARYHSSMIYGIEYDNGHIYGFEYADDPVVHEFGANTIVSTPTKLDIVQYANGDVQIHDNKLIWVSYDKQPMHSYINILCKGENKWKTLFSDGISSRYGNVLVARTGIFTYDSKISMMLKLGNGSAIKGLAYLDLDSNCTYDSASDVKVPYRIVRMKSKKSEISAMTGATGEYEMFVLPDTFIASGYVPVNACTDTLVEVDKLDTTYINDIAYPKPDKHDIKVELISSFNARWNSTVNYVVLLENLGMECDSAHFRFILDNKLKVLSGDSNIRYISNDTASGIVYKLKYFDQRKLMVSSLIDTGSTKPGQRLCHQFRAYSYDPESDSSNNELNFCQNIVYGYDPNQLTANTYKVLPKKASVIDYFIEFQNEGTDYVEDVVIIDTLPEELNIESFEFIASSHPVRYELNGRILSIYYDDIYLQAKKVNASLSNGFFKYRIVCHNNLNEGEKITNKAYIYFDLNAPIVTNDCIILVSTSNTIDEGPDPDQGSIAYPNPFSGKIKIVSATDQEIQIWDISGKLIYTGNTEGGELEIDAELWPSGLYIMRSGSQFIRILKL